MLRVRAVLILSLVLLVPWSAFAAVVISEIMYDHPGTEGSGEHDWIEVRNTGAGPIDISALRFFEANVNHTLKLDRGSAIIPSGGLAVIASATSTFLLDHSAFIGTLFDSSFNLNSTGELLKLCTTSCSAEGSVIEDSLTYTPIESATDNGDSLQLMNGSWIAAAPTPGVGPFGENSGEGAVLPETTAVAGTPPAASSGGGGTALPEPRIVANAGPDRTVVVGASALYEARAIGELGKPIDNARFIWNFGNGDTREGKSVLYAHSYPGEYVVVLTAASGEISATDRLTVNAIPATVRISAVTSEYIEVSNTGERDAELSFWMLRVGSGHFILPKDTVVLSRRSVRFANSVTKLSTAELNTASLLYPNGTEVVVQSPPVLRAESASAVQEAPPKVPAIVRAPSIREREEVSGAPNAQVASPVAAGVPVPVNAWTLAFVGLVGVSALAVVTVRRRSRKGSGYTITEVGGFNE